MAFQQITTSTHLAQQIGERITNFRCVVHIRMGNLTDVILRVHIEEVGDGEAFATYTLKKERMIPIARDGVRNRWNERGTVSIRRPLNPLLAKSICLTVLGNMTCTVEETRNVRGR